MNPQKAKALFDAWLGLTVAAVLTEDESEKSDYRAMARSLLNRIPNKELDQAIKEAATDGH